MAGATGRCGSAQAANQVAGGFVRTLPEVPTTADSFRCTFPDHRRALKSSRPKCNEMNLSCPPTRYTSERNCWLCRVPSCAVSSCADLEILPCSTFGVDQHRLQRRMGWDGQSEEVRQLPVTTTTAHNELDAHPPRHSHGKSLLSAPLLLLR